MGILPNSGSYRAPRKSTRTSYGKILIATENYGSLANDKGLLHVRSKNSVSAERGRSLFQVKEGVNPHYHLKERMGQAQNDEDCSQCTFAAILVDGAQDCLNRGGHRLLRNRCRAHVQDDAGVQTVLVADRTQVRVCEQRLLDLGPLAWARG